MESTNTTSVEQPRVDASQLEVKDSAEGIKTCPRCGWTATDKPKINEADLKEFMRCILGGRTFSKMYPFYEGRGQAVFVALNTADTDLLNECIYNCGKTTEIDIRNFSLKVKLLYLLSAVTLDKEPLTFSKPDFRSLRKDELALAVETEYTKRFGEMNDCLVQILLRIMLLFVDLQQQLTLAALDDSFWKAAGPC